MGNVSFSTLSSLFVAFCLHRALCTVSENGCPDKSPAWVDLGGDFCYLIERNSTVTWIDAVHNCFSEGGSLASFHSIEEVQRVFHHVNHELHRYYIGLWKHYDGSLEWVDKSAVDFRNWDTGEPNFAFEKCVEMYYDSGKWNDIDCKEELGYICSSPKSRRPLSGPRKLCPFNSLHWYDLGGDVCYITETRNKASWTDALKRCSEAGGSLASFHSMEEISVVLQLTKRYDEMLHIGLRQNDYGTYKWADGSPFDLDYWKHGEPSNTQKICAEMDPKNGYWYDVSCGKVSGYICSAPKAACGGAIYSDGGFIFSPNIPDPYGPDEDCTWYITVPEDHQVALEFTVFDVEYSNACQYDFVEVLDGHGSGSPLLDKFCGSRVSNITRSSKNKMAVRFITDSSDNGIGFSATFAKAGICGGDVVAEKGFIRSPNYPNDYGPGEKCVWKIALPENQTVSLNFLKFEVERSNNYVADFVEILDGHEMTSPVLGKFCGLVPPGSIQSSGNKMTVVFGSDLSREEFGFLAEFRRGDCGGDIYSKTGVISSPSYPENYSGSQTCTWRITVPQGHHVVLQFQSFYLQSSPFCTSDFVEIRDGHHPRSPLLVHLCGEGPIEVIRSSTNKMAVTFVSHDTVHTRGFTATFANGRMCGADIFAEKGAIQSPNFPNNYGAGEKCVWNITVPENNKVSLKFLTFHMADHYCKDFVQIQDEGNTRYPLSGRFCGSVLPAGIVSAGDKMTVVFSSDLFEENTGFSAEFEIDTCGGDIFSDRGNISSPNYPDNYRRNENCTWKITVPEKYRVLLEFQSFYLEGGDCYYDFVEVRDGHESDSPVLGRFCGTHLPEVISSSGNKITVTFVSDNSDQRKGFQATFAKDDSNTYYRMEAALRELPAIFLQHKLPKAKELVVTKPNKSPKKSLKNLFVVITKP